MTPEELAAIREQMYWPDGSERDEWEAIEDVKEQRRALLAHIDAITEAVGKLDAAAQSYRDARSRASRQAAIEAFIRAALEPDAFGIADAFARTDATLAAREPQVEERP